MANVKETHVLKMDKDVFAKNLSGLRGFTIRSTADRDFHIGDIVIERETVNSGQEMAEGAPLEYTGREIHSHITYIENGPSYGLQEGWAILQLRQFRTEDHGHWSPEPEEEPEQDPAS